MALNFVFANNVSTTLASPITSTTQTSITLTSSANLPTIPAGSFFVLTLNDAATQSVFEVLHCTAISGATLTVQRGQEGTAAQTWLSGDYAYGAVTAGILSNLELAAAGASSQVLAPNGTVATSPLKIVTGTATFTTSSTVAVTLSGAATFMSGTYTVSAGGATGSSFYTVTSINQTSSGFTLVNYSVAPGSSPAPALLPNPTVVPWTAIGF